MDNNINFDYITKLNQQLGINLTKQFERNLQLFSEEPDCIEAGSDYYNRKAYLHPDVIPAWQAMVQAAMKDNVSLHICSAYRSYSYQAQLIQRKLDNGDKIENIISVLAPPGFSEHHTGRAIDIITNTMQSLDQSFELTDAYKWLTKYAQDFKFILSYPRNNNKGIIFEPWHWCYQVGS